MHGVDAAGQIVIRRKLTRGRVLGFFENLSRCLGGIEACSSSHYWARELIARGHDVRLLPAQYVKPYLKRQTNDAADAEVICEARHHRPAAGPCHGMDILRRRERPLHTYGRT